MHAARQPLLDQCDTKQAAQISSTALWQVREMHHMFLYTHNIFEENILSEVGCMVARVAHLLQHFLLTKHRKCTGGAHFLLAT